MMDATVKDLDQPEFNMSTYHEFMPWQTWKTTGDNKSRPDSPEWHSGNTQEPAFERLDRLG